MTDFDQTISQIQNVDLAVYQQALERHTTLTKPPGSLGRLETLGARLAAVQGTVKPRISKKAVAVFAADHGVTASGVSAYPKEVTAGMVRKTFSPGAQRLTPSPGAPGLNCSS